MSMENKMTSQEEEFALAEATKARQYLHKDSEPLEQEPCLHTEIINGECSVCKLLFTLQTAPFRFCFTKGEA